MEEAVTAFVFTAQGTQWPGMGRDLMAEDPVFRNAILRCDQSIRRHYGWSLSSELGGNPASCRLHDDSDRVQPALTALQIALTESLTSRGVLPDSIGSLSMGEAAGAYRAGMVSLDGAIDIACSTARLAETRIREGLMAFMRATWAECAGLTAGVADRVALAVELGPRLTVISGEAAAVREAMLAAAAQGIGCGPLPLAQAYHSPDVRGLGEAFVQRLSGLQPRRSAIRYYSGVTGDLQAEVSASHYWRICSKPSLFYTLARSMVRDGYRRFVEIGPHPMLGQSIEEAAQELGASVEVHTVMRRGQSASASLEHVATACRKGAHIVASNNS